MKFKKFKNNGMKIPFVINNCLVKYFFKKNVLDVSKLQNRRRQWHPTPVLLPGKSHGWRSLVGRSPWQLNRRSTSPQTKSVYRAPSSKYSQLSIFLPNPRLKRLMRFTDNILNDGILYIAPFLSINNFKTITQ